MFEIDRKNKRLSKLDTKTFGELKIKERDDLQEWLANCPSALGEELLIIQKEFAGFDGTKERLDLLALDKNGSLVIIENKLDDSGRDVVWQALKYVAYCSTLKKSDIAGIFQDYLKEQGTSDDAGEIMCRFLEVGSIDEAEINVGTSQRIILVAANFRKEVTSTVIWLIANRIDAQCMKVTPYTVGEKLLLHVNQIIPTPETEDYMIGMSSKHTEEKAARAVLANSEQLRLRFWECLLDHFRQSKFDLYKNVSPSKDHWLTAGSGMSGCVYTLIFLKKEVRVEFNIWRASQEENKRIFDFLHKKKEKIESRFGGQLEWQRLNEKKSSKICVGESFDGFEEGNWEDMIGWLFDHMKKLENAFGPEVPNIRKFPRT